MNEVSREIRLYAHRGSSAQLPENTIAAFRKALADGANALEMDVHCTHDGHFVISHDCSGRRMADVSRRISETSLQKIKQWDMGAGYTDQYGFRCYAGCGYTMPTLAEVLSELPKVPLSIDLKENNPALLEALIELISTHKAEHRVTLASFHDRLVRKARLLGYPGPTALTRSEVLLLRLLPLAIIRNRVGGQAAQVPPYKGLMRLDTNSFVSRCRRLGIRLDYWVVNDAEQAVDLLRRGATGIMTDDPERIAPAVREVINQPQRAPGLSPA